MKIVQLLSHDNALWALDENGNTYIRAFNQGDMNYEWFPANYPVHGKDNDENRDHPLSPEGD